MKAIDSNMITIMKRITAPALAAGILALLATGCAEEYRTYSDAEYVMFADTMSINMVVQDQDYFAVPVASTTACDYDRTFAVEIIDKGSKAIEGYHYRLKSNTITIKAGERRADVLVHGIYDHIGDTDSLGFNLRLVMPEQLKWDLYTDRTKVVMYKSCPFVAEDFTGWCVVTSMFLLSYPGVENSSMQRLIRTEKHPDEAYAVILRDFLFTGYDVTIRFDPEDPANPCVTMDADQVLSDEISVFGQINGDDKILVTHSPYAVSTFNACQRYVSLWIRAYVENLGETVGTVGSFFNVLEWVSDEEADRLRREEGM